MKIGFAKLKVRGTCPRKYLPAKLTKNFDSLPVFSKKSTIRPTFPWKISKKDHELLSSEKIGAKFSS